MTITEGLAEIKTLAKRIEKKRESVRQYLLRHSIVIDPLEKEGGSREFVRKERQAIGDMEKRIVAIRIAIQKINQVTFIQIGEDARTIAEWLTWRKEIATGQNAFYKQLHQGVLNARAEALKRGGQSGEAVDANAQNIIVNVEEGELVKLMENHEHIIGTLDGLLSLKNATIQLELP